LAPSRREYSCTLGARRSISGAPKPKRRTRWRRTRWQGPWQRWFHEVFPKRIAHPSAASDSCHPYGKGVVRAPLPNGPSYAKDHGGKSEEAADYADCNCSHAPTKNWPASTGDRTDTKTAS